jgi:hypothetical protein
MTETHSTTHPVNSRVETIPSQVFLSCLTLHLRQLLHRACLNGICITKVFYQRTQSMSSSDSAYISMSRRIEDKFEMQILGSSVQVKLVLLLALRRPTRESVAFSCQPDLNRLSSRSSLLLSHSPDCIRHDQYAHLPNRSH